METGENRTTLVSVEVSSFITSVLDIESLSRLEGEGGVSSRYRAFGPKGKLSTHLPVHLPPGTTYDVVGIGHTITLKFRTLISFTDSGLICKIRNLLICKVQTY